MNYRIIPVVQLTGPACHIYTIIRDGASDTAFHEFLQQHDTTYSQEVRDIVLQLEGMGKRTGARDYFFKLAEGRLGDLVAAIKDEPGRKLRLFCIRFNNYVLILGGGAPKNVRAWENDPDLSKVAHELIAISEGIKEALKNKTLKWNEEGTDLTGDLTIELEDE